MTDDEIDKIAERAASKAIKKAGDEFFAEVGRTVIKRWLIIIGSIAVAIAYGKGWISIPK